MKTITTVTSATLVGSTLTIVCEVADQTQTSPAQQVTVGEVPPSNSSWSRWHRVTNAVHLVGRNGANTVAFLLSALASVAVALENSLTFAPKYTTQPEDQTAAANSDAGEFAVVVASELTAVTYQWQSSPDGTVWSNLSNGGEVSGATTATLTITPTSSTYNGYQFRCRATNAVGTTDSDAATMTVT